MAIKITPKGDRYVAEVTPPDGQWRTPHPMSLDELAVALKGIGVNREALSDAFDDAALRSYRSMADEFRPQVTAALNGKRAVPGQGSSTEAWITYALNAKNHPITIQELVEVADGLYHAIPTPDEISWTLLQLRTRGWLLVEGNRYALTAEGHEVVERIACGGFVLENIDRLKEWIDSHPPR